MVERLAITADPPHAPGAAAGGAVAGAVQARAFEVATHAPLGEYVQPQAGRKSIKGWLTSGLAHTYWNIKK